jgi:hypothetical protein
MKIEAGKLLLEKNFKEYVKKTVNNDISHIRSGGARDREAYADAVRINQCRLEAIEGILRISKHGLSDSDKGIRASQQIVEDKQQAIIEINGYRFVFGAVGEKLVFLYVA